MSDTAPATAREPATFRFELRPHRSLGRNGFLLLMGGLCLVSFVAGVVFSMMGAWPVTGFFGLDVALVYLAFRLNYRAGRAHEIVEVTPDVLSITRVEPSGRRRTFICNPYWARVNLTEWPDGSTDLSVRTQETRHSFARVLNNDERRDFAAALKDALLMARGGARI